jgi:hypothetical protein
MNKVWHNLGTELENFMGRGQPFFFFFLVAFYKLRTTLKAKKVQGCQKRKLNKV